MKKVIVTFTPTGMLIQKDQTPYIPVSPQEIIADVREACEIGISSVHLHARDPKTGDPVFPYYLPAVRPVGMIVIRADDIRKLHPLKGET